MSETQAFIPAVIAELSRRKVLKTMGGYALGVFIVLQLLDAAVEPLRLPGWFPTVVIIALILGFPVVFLLAWQFDITGKGLHRTGPDSTLTRGQRNGLFALMIALTAALGTGFWQYYSGVLQDEVGVNAAPLAAAGRDFSAPENSIAVLPFADLSASGDQAFLTDGIAEEILNLLAQVDGLHVAARTSSFAFRNPQVDVRKIGRALNVRTVLEGSVRSVGNRIRLTAQLINVEDGYHIWSQNFDRELDDVFALQDEVASAIAASLVDSFGGLAARPATRASNLAAFEAYRTGRLHWWRRSPQELQKAIGLFAEALQHDPAFAPAYAALADSMILLSLYGNIAPMDAIERAMPNIERALAIDPESAEGFAALGLARMQIEQVDAAESALRQAISLNADYIPAHLWLSNLLGVQGRAPEQGKVLEQAMALDPLNELLAVNYAGNLLARGKFEESLDLLEGLIAVKPDSATLLSTMSDNSMAQGNLVAAWEYANRAYQLEPDSPKMLQVVAKAWMELGDLEEAERWLLAALELAGDNAEVRFQHFVLLFAAGRYEEAESVMRDLFGDDPRALPEHMQRYYHFQYGLLRVAGGDLPAARDAFERAINPELSLTFENEQMFSITMSAYLNDLLGNADLAEQRLGQAEHGLRRARLNGIETGEVYYTQSVIQVLRGEHQPALESLRLAFERGFRQTWVLDIDRRLDPLRNEPEFVALRHDIEADLRQALETVRGMQVALL